MATKSESAADAKVAMPEMPANGEWSEEQLEEGLKQLKLLYIKARKLMPTRLLAFAQHYGTYRADFGAFRSVESFALHCHACWTP